MKGEGVMDKIAIKMILPNPEQPRKVFDQAELESLAQSIRENGVIQPVLVEATVDAEVFILHDGERRTRAAAMAGLAEVPAVITPALNGSGSHERLMRALVANLQRQDLNPIDEAKGYRRLREQDDGMTVREISIAMGIYESRIGSRMKLLELEEEIQELVARGLFPCDITVTQAMLKLPAGEVRLALARKLAETKAGNKTCRVAAQILKRTLDRAAEGVEVDGVTPMIRQSVGKHGAPNRERWDMLKQTGQVPPWAVVECAALAVCKECVLREVASSKVCDQCPGVSFVGKLIEKANIEHQ